MHRVVPVLHQRQPAQRQEGEARDARLVQGGTAPRASQEGIRIQGIEQHQGYEDYLHSGDERERNQH